MTFASVSRTAGAIALFRGDNLGATAGAGNANIDFTTLAPANLVGGNTTMVNKPIVTWAIGEYCVVGSGVGFVTYNIDPLSNAANATGIRPLSLANEYTTATGVAGVNLNVPVSVSPNVSRTFNSMLLSGGFHIHVGRRGCQDRDCDQRCHFLGLRRSEHDYRSRNGCVGACAVEGKVSTLGESAIRFGHRHRKPGADQVRHEFSDVGFCQYLYRYYDDQCGNIV